MVFFVTNVVQINAGLQMCSPAQCCETQIQRRIPLDALRMADQILKVTAERKLGRDLERTVSMRLVGRRGNARLQPHVQQRPL